jgi:hypothetical protein
VRSIRSPLLEPEPARAGRRPHGSRSPLLEGALDPFTPTGTRTSRATTSSFRASWMTSRSPLLEGALDPVTPTGTRTSRATTPWFTVTPTGRCARSGHPYWNPHEASDDLTLSRLLDDLTGGKVTTAGRLSARPARRERENHTGRIASPIPHQRDPTQFFRRACPKMAREARGKALCHSVILSPGEGENRRAVENFSDSGASREEIEVALFGILGHGSGSPFSSWLFPLFSHFGKNRPLAEGGKSL